MAKVGVKRFLKLMLIHAKMDLASLMRDTAFMLVAIFSDIVSNISAISGIFLLAWKFGSIGGMGRFEILFMLAYGNIVNGLLDLMGGCNALFPSRIIGRGQWEHMFIMPLPYAVQLTVGIFPFTCSTTFLSGVALMWAALRQMQVALTFGKFAVLAVNIIASMAVLIALSYLFSSLAFYAPVQCEEIATTVISGMRQAMTFPLSGMPGYLKYPLLTVFPAGLMAWLPTMIILGREPSWVSFYPAAAAVVLSLTAAWFFRKGFLYYVQKGINRYVSGGHRR